MIINRIRNGLNYRWKWMQLGVPFFRSRNYQLKSLQIHGHNINLTLPFGEEKIHEHELSLIYFDDCYHISSVIDTPKVIVDIGGNIGFFSMIARHYFPLAEIYCYEPNTKLAKSLSAHLDPINVKYYFEAVGDKEGFVSLRSGDNSLHNVSIPNSEGVIPVVSLDTVVKRCGGSIDLLKLDCEGAEWHILENCNSLQVVREITMEYHLWAKPGSSIGLLKKLLNDQGFIIKSINNDPNKSWGILYAHKF